MMSITESFGEPNRTESMAGTSIISSSHLFVQVSAWDGIEARKERRTWVLTRW